MFARYEEFAIDTGEVRITGRAGGQGSPLLLLHGHPQTHLIWHRIADDLALDHHVIAMDLRGYGHSSRPPGGGDHAAYSKRTMARDAIEVMRQFGHERFAVAAHDRGARVAARLVADHPDAVSAAILMDIAPTLDMYEGTTRDFATAYWHWFFLIQPEPLPELLIAGDPAAYIELLMGNRPAGLAPFPPEVLQAYVKAMTGPNAAHGMCEDYRAAATIDLEHDRADRAAGHRITTPLRVLWGRHGVVEQLFDPLTLWRAVADDVSGEALDCGHYLPEEAPGPVLAHIRDALDDGPTDPDVAAVPLRAPGPKGTGYDPAFLGLDLPAPTSAHDDAVLLDGSPWLPYQHFSVMLSSTRRLARQVAWTIDAATLQDLPRSGLRFRADPRIDEDLQVLDDVYAANRLDRGHLARRADLLWGTVAQARRANSDSFYFTNITPQMDTFNQSGKAGDWGLLENSLLEYVRQTPLPRVAVFGGPVLADDDPAYRGVAVPLSFWKVLAYRVEDALTCKAFLVTQSLAGLEPFGLDDQYLIHGLPLRELEERTGLGFADVLHDASRAPAGLRPTRSVVTDPFAIDWSR
ncbi:DNA/RNA endonuclease G (NUC1)/pimeloyl-ACP methyl ester carboxylesterase [Kineosphaera limosa]|uniref:Hydrolase n=1 Tax=Kineosphaera limosa NBRC 100340 TaxID=1184609 RepID=K6WZU6_9MICO|nr:alpha/beta fold hydrolase [Kineosphaera limosa]NYD99512.1 DNA/RNA endonuclease G (NUC1)/pimeloyl-ACP methyl ester carboxylesterase [Kineosphaera limosa]GAB97642.1 hypothetical protein KILIM_076_00270 [Kineosphaera limosa NBRC 100340]